MVKPKKILFSLITLCCLINISCREDASGLVKNTSQKLFVMSELIPGEQVSVEVSSTIPLLNDYEYLDIDENTIVNVSSSEGVYPLKYSHKGELSHTAVFTREEGMNIFPGELYTVSVTPPYEDVNAVDAITKIPPEPKFEFINIVNFDEEKNQDNPKLRLYTYNVQLDVERDSEDLDATRFYHIIPLLREVTIDLGAPVIGTYTNNFYNHVDYYFSTGQKACFELKDMYGFLVDADDLEEDEFITATFTAEEEIDIRENEHKFLHFLLYSVTEEYYSYHKAISNAISANSYNSEEVVLDRSNVRNGRGLVSGMNVRLDSTSIR